MQPFRVSAIESIGDLIELSKSLTLFAFRGQADARWELATSLERAYAKSGQTVYSLETTEHWMLHDFQNKFHLYSNSAPRCANNFEWLALMQHHGGATRLLDFTHSIYIAAYFAVVGAQSDAAIWAINRPELRDNLRAYAQLPYTHGKDLKDVVNECHIETFNKFVARTHRSAIDNHLKHLIPLESQSLFDRASRQKSLFIAAGYLGSIGEPFSYMDNLCASFVGMAEALATGEYISIRELAALDPLYKDIVAVKIIIPRPLQARLRQELALMGLSDESLFPGLDGLARSLVHTHIFR